MTTKYQSLDFREQITFFRNKVNVPTATWRDVWREGHDKSFMVAGAMKADILNDFNKAIDKAIAQGTTIAEFRKDFDRIVDTHGWSYNGSRGWRSRVIFETNLRTSYQSGRYAQLTNPKLLKSRPYWRYKHSDSVQHPRPLHLKWDGTVLHYSEPWWKTHFCPNGWGCKCKIFAESERTMRRLGKDGSEVAPDDGLVDGRPAGIDEGWDYAPGASVSSVTRSQVTKKAKKLPPQLKKELLEEIKTIPVPPPLPDVKRPKTSAFSTVKGFNNTELDNLLASIPGAEAEMEKLAEFIEAADIKTLFLKSTEMGTGKKAYALRYDISEYLQVPSAWGLYNSRRVRRTNGFTFAKFKHVVVKAKAADKISNANVALMRETVGKVIDRAGDEKLGPIWSLRAAYDELAGSKGGNVVTWLHEVSHQLHFAAGTPSLPKFARLLTEYSGANGHEWHAEHLTAWLLNREALQAADNELVKYLDELVDSAINNSRDK